MRNMPLKLTKNKQRPGTNLGSECLPAFTVRRLQYDYDTYDMSSNYDGNLRINVKLSFLAKVSLKLVG